MVKPLELQVHVARDEETGRWYVAESDIPGLRLEAESASRLIERVTLCASEMIELNKAELFAAGSLGANGNVTVRPVFDSPLELAAA